MTKYENWYSDKVRLNAAIARLNYVKDRMPSVHNDTVLVGESGQMWEAINSIESAIRYLDPLQRYKKPLPGQEVGE